MKSDSERIEEFLKGIVLPEYKSDGHARQLRAQILSGLQARRAGRGTSSWWKTAALLLGLLGAAALATETIIQVRHYYFVDKAKDGSYLVFSTAPKEAGGSFDTYMVGVGSNLDAAGIEQKRKDLEEVDALRQRNARELVRVTDTEVKGNPPRRGFLYKYVLADGRTSLNNEGQEGDQQQIARLRQRGQREILNIVEEEVGGQRLRRFTYRYVLSDGRALTMPETDPEQPGPLPLTTEQQLELAQLVWLDPGKGKFLLGSAQVQMLGRTVTLQRYSFKLSDGTVVTRSEAQLDASKRDLSAAQWQELNRLSAAQKGETLGTYEENVMGKPFKFTRVKYVLSDGTEVIQSSGKPGSER
jgi:hypothetical protein